MPGAELRANSAWPTSCMYAMSSPYHRVVSEPPAVISVPREPHGGGVEQGDGLPVYGPVQTAEHDGACIE
jgi:hypothetical protein